MNEHNEPRCCFDAAAYTGTPDALPCPQVVDVPSTIKKLDEILNAENLSAAAGLLVGSEICIRDRVCTGARVIAAPRKAPLTAASRSSASTVSARRYRVRLSCSTPQRR